MTLLNLPAAIVVGGLLLSTPPAATGPSQSLQEGIALFDKGDREAAESFFRKHAEADPKEPWAPYYLGRIQFDRNEAEEAVESLSRAVELAPDNPDFHLWLGRAYLQELSDASMFRMLGLSKKVRLHYLTAIELDPDHLEARESLAGYYFEAPGVGGGSKSDGMEQVEAIRARDPLRAHIFLGSYYWGKEEYELARTELEAALALDPEAASAHLYLGFVEQSLESWDAAFASFEKALELEPRRWESLYQIGRTASLSGKQLDRGIECFTAYLGHQPTPDEPGLEWAHYRLGLIYEHQGQRAKALEEYRAALAIDPEHEQAEKALKKLS